MSINPFKVLGLTPGIVGQLSDEGILRVVKSNYKTLSLTLHPDMGGTDVAFGRISQAYSVLTENQPAFDSYKAAYLMSRKDQLGVLSTENEDLCERVDIVTDQLHEYVGMVIRMGGIPISGSLLMYDSLRVALEEGSYRSLGYAAEKKLAEKRNFSLDRANGEWIRTPLIFGRDFTAEGLADDHYKKGDSWILVIKGSARGWSPKGKSRSLGCAIIGTIADQREGEDGIGLKRALAIRGEREDFDRAREGYGWDYFQYLLPTLSTEVKPGSYLVGASLADGEIRFFLLGKIIAVDKEEGAK